MGPGPRRQRRGQPTAGGLRRRRRPEGGQHVGDQPGHIVLCLGGVGRVGHRRDSPLGAPPVTPGRAGGGAAARAPRRASPCGAPRRSATTPNRFSISRTTSQPRTARGSNSTITADRRVEVGLDPQRAAARERLPRVGLEELSHSLVGHLVLDLFEHDPEQVLLPFEVVGRAPPWSPRPEPRSHRSRSRRSPGSQRAPGPPRPGRPGWHRLVSHVCP